MDRGFTRPARMVPRIDGRASRAFDRQAADAFLSYLGLSLLFFGRGLVRDFSSYHIGTGPDPGQSIWYLAWWAHAITHRLNSLLPDVLFVPCGANLAWATDVPLATLFAMPLTLTIGPVAAYNVLMLAPPLAGWAAFVLCRYLARSWRAGWLGGFIFGFSPYVVNGMLGRRMGWRGRRAYWKCVCSGRRVLLGAEHSKGRKAEGRRGLRGTSEAPKWR